MKNDSDYERDEVLCLNSDHLECLLQGKAVESNIKFLKYFYFYSYYENNTHSLWKM